LERANTTAPSKKKPPPKSPKKANTLSHLAPSSPTYPTTNWCTPDEERFGKDLRRSCITNSRINSLEIETDEQQKERQKQHAAQI
jgi:hypothetical protein